MRKSIPMDSFITKVGGRTRPTHRNEFPAEYSLASCSAAELASAFPAELILQPKPPFGQKFSSNGYCRINSLSHRRAQSTHPSSTRLNQLQQVSPRAIDSKELGSAMFSYNYVTSDAWVRDQWIDLSE